MEITWPTKRGRFVMRRPPLNELLQWDSLMKSLEHLRPTNRVGEVPAEPGFSRRLRLGRSSAFPLMLLPIILLGCQEPKDYRTEVVGNGEGGVEIHRVPKDPSEVTSTDSTPTANRSALEQRVEVLEATVLRQQQEIAELHHQLNSKNHASHRPLNKVHMSYKIDRSTYADIYGPTTGDKVRLGDTSLILQVEKDFAIYGDECKFGGGKTIREENGLKPQASVIKTRSTA